MFFVMLIVRFKWDIELGNATKTTNTLVSMHDVSFFSSDLNLCKMQNK